MNQRDQANIRECLKLSRRLRLSAAAVLGSSEATSLGLESSGRGGDLVAAVRRLRGLVQELKTDLFEEDVYLQLNPDVAAAVRCGKLPSGRDHWIQYGKDEARTGGPADVVPDRSDSIAALEGRPFGVNLFGFLTSKSGLGEAARGCRSAIAATGIQSCHIDIAPWKGGVEKRILPETPFRVNLIQQNADMMARFARNYGPDVLMGRYNIGYWFWELPSVRSDWFDAYRYVDEIWVASEFCRQAFQCVTNVPVVRIPVVVDRLEDKALYDRSHFGLPRDAFVFCHTFDIASQFERKNPIALVRAFRNAFGNSREVMLILKYSNSTHDQAAVLRLAEAIGGAPNIRTIDRLFSDQEIVSLHASIDCLVSPHRSEGFGFNIAEAMYFGKPVIASRYSSNLDFMSDENGYLIDCSLTPIGVNKGPYLRGAVWAEPSVEHLTYLLRRVFDHPEERERKGRAAASRIREQCSARAAGEFMERRLKDLQLDSPHVSSSLQLHPHRGVHKPRCPESTPKEIERAIRSLGNAPVISVIVPVYNVDASLLRRCIESVRRQWYPYWELCLCDDGSDSAATTSALLACRGVDSRIKIIRSETNGGIAAASNRAAEISTGEYIALLDNDDEITPDALFRIVQALNQAPDADLLYTDEDKLEPDGSFSEPYYKPDWSPEHLRSVMYLLHMLVLSKKLFYAAGAFRPEFSGSQDYDLALRASLLSRRIAHVPAILYHWRKIPGSAAAVVDAKPKAIDAAQRALEEHLKTIDPEAWVEPGKLTGLFRARFPVHGNPLVSLCIPTNDGRAEVEGRGSINLLEHFVKSIAANTSYANYEIIICDNNNLSEGTREALSGLPYRLCSYPGPTSPFNFADKANFLCSHARGEHIVLLNDDLEVISPDWLTALLELSQQPDIGVVGARLLFPNDRIQHVGVVIGVNGGAAHVYHNYPADTIGYNGFTHLIRNYAAVTGACMATRREVWQRLGGFDRAFAVDYNDIDYCLRVLDAGYRIVYTPYAELYHFEGRTETRTAANPATQQTFAKRWAKYMERDPYYNPNLTRDGVNFAPLAGA